jgi:hypothetical protein
MEFKVHTPFGEKPFHGESTYQLQNDAVLRVVDAAARQTIIYSPAGWLSVAVITPPKDRHVSGRVPQ